MNKYIAGFLSGCLLLLTQCAQKENKQGQIAEYNRAVTILLHQPCSELLAGVVHPRAAGFDAYFDIDQAASEHAAYRSQLEKFGANVYSVREVLLRGTKDQNGNAVEGEALRNLRDLAFESLTYNTSQVPALSQEQELYKRSVINAATPTCLVDIILNRPLVVLSYGRDTTVLTGSYIQNPALGLFEIRDHIIVTGKGIVVGKLASPSHQWECKIVEFCTQKMGFTPLGRVTGKEACLEGRDHIPFGRTSFIGCGSRTNQQAIDQLMDNDWLLSDTLVVVKDHLRSALEPHLSSYFNVIDRDLVTLTWERYSAPADSAAFLRVDVYVREDNSYRKIADSEGFVPYLVQRMKLKVLAIPAADCETHAHNYLTVAPRQIMAVSGQSQEFQNLMHENGVGVTWIPMDNLLHGRAAAYSLTQVLGREENYN